MANERIMKTLTINGVTYQVAGGGSGLTDDAKQALLTALNHVAWTDEHGQDYVDALEEALYPPANLVSISAVYTQSGTVYDTDSLDSLKSDLVVTALFDDMSTRTIVGYTLSGTLVEGTCEITVTYMGETATFSVAVSAEALLYPFVNGKKTFSDGSVLTISNGNHIKYECKSTFAGSSTGNPLFNVSNIADITTDMISNSSSINNKAPWITFNSNDAISLTFENVSGGNDTFLIQSNFRKANETNAVLPSAADINQETATKTHVFSTQNITSCLYLFFHTCRANTTYEMDAHLTVNGVKYF